MKMGCPLAALLAFLGWSGVAAAAIPDSLHDPANCRVLGDEAAEAPLSFAICNDGVPAAGGTRPNDTGAAAITVPAEYGGDGFTGLPSKKTPTALPGADGNGNIALDVNVSLPLAAPPPDGYPLLFFMHGCCGGNKSSWESGDPFAGTPVAPRFDDSGEKWHYNNAWFASRGYVVVTYTARGFVNASNGGSTGETQLDSRRFEINDYQHLACQIYAHASAWNDVTGQNVRIDPRRIVATGGSYGGGFSWMALTDPVWTCTAETGVAQDTPMKLAAVAPKYGWTDLLYSLVPTGRHRTSPAAPAPRTDGCDSGPRKLDGSPCEGSSPVGMSKASINAGLYGTGKNPAGNHTTFTAAIDEAQLCLSGPYPFESNPACGSVIDNTLPEFLRERSAYYQNDFFERIAADPSYRIPVFNAATLTDPLFPPQENLRMHNRLRAATGGGYPLAAYFGDFQHFVPNKAKEWADLCLDADGSTRRVCNNDDFAGDFNANPANLRRLGITTRLNRFVDHYARPAANPAAPPPPFNITAALTVCAEKEPDAAISSEPGETFSAASFEQLADGVLRLDSGADPATLTASAGRNLTSSAAPNGVHADPVADSGTCEARGANEPAPPGVAVYESAALPADTVLLGTPLVTAEFTPSGDAGSLQLNARLYEVLPSGAAVMASRGFLRLTADQVAAGTVSFELFSQGWRFTQGNRIRLELMQDDTPYLKASTPPSGLSLTRVSLDLPTRSAPTNGGGNRGGAFAAVTALLVLAGALLRRRLASPQMP